MPELEEKYELLFKAYSEQTKMFQSIEQKHHAQTELYKALENKINKVLEKKTDGAFNTTLTNIKSTQSALILQIWAFILISALLVGASFYLIFFRGDSPIITPVIIPIIVISISFLIVILWLILRLNLIRESLSNKHLALSTFAEIQPILQNSEKDMSYEYRAVLKRILDSLNNLIDNTQNEL
jgi:hypothetical protein